MIWLLPASTVSFLSTAHAELVLQQHRMAHSSPQILYDFSPLSLDFAGLSLAMPHALSLVLMFANSFTPV